MTVSATAQSEERLAELRRLLNGYQVSQALHVAAALGIADLLAEGARSSDALAGATETDRSALYRLLRALASVGILHEEERHRFALTPLGELLRSDSPYSLAGWAAFVGRPYVWNAWAGLLDSVCTGENAFERLHGADAWTYRAEHPAESAIFDRAMESLTRLAAAGLLDAYDFGRFRTVVDVGGGNGTLLAAILGRYPGLHGVLFDQPHVVAPAPALLEQAGVADRCDIVGGDFFDSVPEGRDAYLLRAVLHDWNDEDALRILRTVRGAVADDGTLLVVERVVGPSGDAGDAAFSDLQMLVVLGGRERTLHEFADLFGAASFHLTREIPAGTHAILEAEPA